MRVALFATCLVDTVAPQVAMATARLLERLGHEVVVPPGQACCGQMHVNTGYRREAVPIVANHVRAFAGAEAGVSPSGSDRKSTRLNSRHPNISYAVFCLKKKRKTSSMCI